MYFRSSTRRRFPLQFDLIVINGGTDEIFQSTLINLIALEKIDRSPRVAFEARVEELVRIWEARPVGKGKLHFIFVGVGDGDYSVVRPHWASHPLPFLDYLPVGLKDALADAANVLPRQSVSSAISWSIRSDGFIGSLCLEFLSRICHLKINRTIATRYDKLARRSGPTGPSQGPGPRKPGNAAACFTQF